MTTDEKNMAKAGARSVIWRMINAIRELWPHLVLDYIRRNCYTDEFGNILFNPPGKHSPENVKPRRDGYGED